MKIPQESKRIYSVNEGNYLTWDVPMQKAIDNFKLNKPIYSARYVGSMVADIHRTLLYGGIYLYPADSIKGNGKLRLLYEGFPMAKIIEEAGGSASSGMFRGKIARILDLVPENIHAKCPVVIGSKRDVDLVLDYYSKN
jgi:fructose-1,6-bisphosphatase I